MVNVLGLNITLHTTKPDTKKVNPFITINSFGNSTFSKYDLFIKDNDIEHK